MNRLLAVFFFISSLFHLVAIAVPTISMPEPLSEHILFSAINLFMGRMLWGWRTEQSHIRMLTIMFLFTVALLQTQRHGQAIVDEVTSAYVAPSRDTQVIVQSVFTILSLWGLLVWMLLRERRR